MCTVIIDVPTDPGTPVRLLAIRDEDPTRPWNPLGHWWPQHPSILGVQDVRAGGAWLAADADTHRLAVLLNRAGGDDLPGFNLLEVDATSARVISWDGERRRETQIEAGIHMIAHDDVDDPATARISHWLEHFRLAQPEAGERWYRPWLEVLERSTALGPVDERASIRDNRPLGYPTLSLLVCAASVGLDGIDVSYAELPAPGEWGHLDLHAPRS